MNIHSRRAVSPVIAVIMILGITVVAAASISVVIFNNTSGGDDIGLDVSEPAHYKTTDVWVDTDDRNIDSFTVEVSNPDYKQLVIDLPNSYVFNATTNQPLSYWRADSEVDIPILSGLESLAVTFINTGKELDQEELANGDEIYVLFSVRRPDENTLKFVESSTFTVTGAELDPSFALTTTSGVTQQGMVVTFSSGLDPSEVDNTEVNTTFRFAIWNFGNSDKAYEKTVSFYLQNKSVFGIDPAHETQTVTVPSASAVGNGDNICEVNEPCVNVAIPITKYNLTEKGIVRDQEIFGAVLSVSGMGFYTVNLTLGPVDIVFQPSVDTIPYYPQGQGEGGAFGQRTGMRYKAAVNQSGTVESEDGNLTITIWNTGTAEFEGTFYLKNLNTTAFQISGSNETTVTIPAGSYPDTFDGAVCGEDGDACVILNWTILRNPMEDENGFTGICSGYYEGTQLAVQGSDVTADLLFYIFTPNGQSDCGCCEEESGSTSTTMIVSLVTLNQQNDKRLTITVLVKFDNGTVVDGASIRVSIAFNDGSSVPLDFQHSTDRFGESTDAYQTSGSVKLPKGPCTVTVTIVSHGIHSEYTFDETQGSPSSTITIT